MWIQVLISVIILPVVVLRVTDWYAKRCVDQSRAIVEERLREFETIANTYTKNGTASELQDLIEDLEEIMDDLQMLEDNNKSD
jgi:hypothetical protein